jgi:hypothetical protein
MHFSVKLMTLNDFANLGSVIGIFFVAAGLLLSIQQFKFGRTMDYRAISFYLSN